MLTKTDELGRVKSYEYDAQGRLTAVELPAVIDPDDSQATRLEPSVVPHAALVAADRTMIGNSPW